MPCGRARRAPRRDPDVYVRSRTARRSAGRDRSRSRVESLLRQGLRVVAATLLAPRPPTPQTTPLPPPSRSAAARRAHASAASRSPCPARARIEQLERRRARRRLGVAGLDEELVQLRRRLRGVPRSSVNAASPRRAMRLRRRLLEQPRGLVQPALAQPQLTQPGERRTVERRARLLEVPRRRGELRFRLGPLAAPDQHAGVLRPADRRERTDAPPLA